MKNNFVYIGVYEVTAECLCSPQADTLPTMMFNATPYSICKRSSCHTECSGSSSIVEEQRHVALEQLYGVAVEVRLKHI